MKLQEFKYYTCISPDPTKCKLRGDTETPDLCKMKYSWFTLSMTLTVNAIVQKVTELICLYQSNTKRSQAEIPSPQIEGWRHVLVTHLTYCALKDIYINIR